MIDSNNPRFRDIPQFTQTANYNVDVSWKYLENHLESYNKDQRSDDGLQLEPDFQRSHVWDNYKRTCYVEYILRGGYAAREIYFNHPGWQRDYKGDFVLVDGLQRLTAVRMFLAGKIEAFGYIIDKHIHIGFLP